MLSQQSFASGFTVPVTKQNQEELPMFMTTKDFAKLSGLSVDVICGLCGNRILPHLKNGKRYMVCVSDAMERLRSLAEQRYSIHPNLEENQHKNQIRVVRMQRKNNDVESAVARLRAMAVNR